MNEPSSNRRKILQGSLAAPLVLTVSSASAQAVTSFTQCIEQAASNQPNPSLNIVPSTDAWFRCPITVYTYSNGSVTVNLYQDGNGTYRNVTNGEAFSITTAWTKTGEATWRRLVYFGTDGSPKGAGWEKLTGGYAVSVSCGGSFGVQCA